MKRNVNIQITLQTTTKRMLTSLLVITTAVLASGCGIQAIPQAKNEVDAKFADVTNEYKRRADLIPNLVQVVKGYATHEKDTLEGVVAARARATQVTVDPTKMTAEKMKEYQAAQGQLSQALGRLLMISENYPNLKADQNFRDLQAQLEGTENRIKVARSRYIEGIKLYNNEITVPPDSWTNSLFYHYEKLPQWDLSEAEKSQNEKAPEVKF